MLRKLRFPKHGTVKLRFSIVEVRFTPLFQVSSLRNLNVTQKLLRNTYVLLNLRLRSTT
jgi:hypothetical protein